MKKNKIKKGFTLIELLVVVAIIAILAAAVFVAINPARRFAEANNSQRWSDSVAILNAILTYTVDNNGTLPAGVNTTTPQHFGTNASGCDANCDATTTASACLDLSADLVSGGYLSSIPIDPVRGNATSTHYYMKKYASGIIQVGACAADSEAGTTPTVKVAR